MLQENDVQSCIELLEVARDVEASTVMLTCQRTTTSTVLAALPALGDFAPAVQTLPGQAHLRFPPSLASDSTVQTEQVSTWPVAPAAVAAFLHEFDEAKGRPVHAYALLALEVGGLLARAHSSGGPLNESLLTAHFDGPRGSLSFDPDTQHTITRHFAVTQGVKASTARGTLLLEPPPELAGSLATTRAEQTKTGWTNPYLIA